MTLTISAVMAVCAALLLAVVTILSIGSRAHGTEGDWRGRWAQAEVDSVRFLRSRAGVCFSVLVHDEAVATSVAVAPDALCGSR